VRFTGALKVLAIVAALAIGGTARAQTAPAAPGVTGSGAFAEGRPTLGPSISHAWIVVPNFAGEKGAVVLHLPPRGTLSDSDGRLVGAVPGEARVAAPLLSAPVIAGAQGSRLAMVFYDQLFPSAEGRKVISLGAAAPTPGTWVTTPTGRLDALPSLRADGLLLGFAGCDAGFCALFQGLVQGNADPTKLVLQMLVGSEWLEVPLSAELLGLAPQYFSLTAGNKPATTAAWQLFAVPGGVGILAAPPRSDTFTLATAKLAAPAAGTKTVPAPTWTSEAVKLQGPRPRERMTVLCTSGQLVITTFEPKGVREGVVHIFTRPLDFPSLAWREIASVPGVASDHALAALDGVGRVAIVSAPAPLAGEKTRDHQNIAEVSVHTGAVVYNGDLTLTSPISKSDYRMVGLILAYALGLVLIFLVKPQAADTIQLPEGYALAEPGRRVVAGIMDFVVALVLASRLWHMPVAEALTPATWWSPAGQSVLLTCVAIAIGLGAVSELFLGRTIGKLITGCEVVGIRVEGQPPPPATSPTKEGEAPAPDHVPFWRLLVRNVIKWGLPPVGLLGLLDPNGRHRGDQFARTAVVIHALDEPEEDDEGEDE
jgi:RDD family